MRKRVVWLAVLVGICAAALGAVAYHLAAKRPPPVPLVRVAPVAPGGDSATLSGRADAGAGPSAATAREKPFRFAPPVASADDIAEVRFIDADGRPMSLAGFRGKVVLLNVWATWCGPCREEMPTLERLQIRLGGPDFEVVALSIDREGIETVRQFYAELELRALRIYVDANGMAPVLLDALGIPTTLLIGRDGREIARFTGPAEWDGAHVVAAIEQHLTSPSAGSAAGTED